MNVRGALALIAAHKKLEAITLFKGYTQDKERA